ncbi:MAG TPA: hypothetical protein VEQ60_31575 [Longimicrobium sp.]|nr:hypothetical protein [Longimicrobium sp.]
MIGGEAAEMAAPGRRPAGDDARDPYELGWVVDWLYGDAVLPPMPLPPEPLSRRAPGVPLHGEVAIPAPAQPRRSGKARRRVRQLALL